MRKQKGEKSLYQISKPIINNVDLKNGMSILGMLLSVMFMCNIFWGSAYCSYNCYVFCIVRGSFFHRSIFKCIFAKAFTYIDASLV